MERSSWQAVSTQTLLDRLTVRFNFMPMAVQHLIDVIVQLLASLAPPLRGSPGLYDHFNSVVDHVDFDSRVFSVLYGFLQVRVHQGCCCALSHCLPFPSGGKL
mmetsp:Transcript_51787/g.102971  ORF Transcript_51787/g.102971 Transcript_51787/m.102971 type:complete len:103 (-) Transcript_51787:110-418(-)